ncbi:MAG: hypothetical protein ABJC79_04600, partial [Acidimicrobiia bacterium]
LAGFGAQQLLARGRAPANYIAPNAAAETSEVIGTDVIGTLAETAITPIGLRSDDVTANGSVADGAEPNPRPDLHHS